MGCNRPPSKFSIVPSPILYTESIGICQRVRHFQGRWGSDGWAATLRRGTSWSSTTNPGRRGSYGGARRTSCGEALAHRGRALPRVRPAAGGLLPPEDGLRHRGRAVIGAPAPPERGRRRGRGGDVLRGEPREAGAQGGDRAGHGLLRGQGGDGQEEELPLRPRLVLGQRLEGPLGQLAVRRPRQGAQVLRRA